ncbi:MAG: hypothetical protein A2020_01375 [Lentisphaerae bacterium GWF2_45_14]|nr:MAG: hypothetical protein A2020_01375 [Lentisphaerae bacterium GWF2_45_14]
MALRLIYLREYSSSPLFYMPMGPDIQEYDEWARKIFAGSIFWKDIQIHSPFYPFFLAGLFRFFSIDYFSVRMAQLIIGVLAALPLYIYLSEKRDGSTLKNMVPGIFLFLFCVYPPLIFYQGEILSEALLLPLICLGIYFIYRAEEMGKDGVRKILFYSFSGLCCGLAVITHPASIFFLVAEAAYLAFHGSSLPKIGRGIKKNIRTLLFFTSAALLPILPVSLYNSLLSGRVSFVQANGGFNFYLGNNSDATGCCYLRPGPEWDAVHRKAEEVSKREEISKDAYFLRESFSFIREHPLQAAMNFIRKGVLVWNYRELCAGADMDTLRYSTGFQRIGRFSFALLGIAGLAGFLIAISRKESAFEYRHFIILAASFWFVQTIFVTSGRYRAPMLPAIFVLASFFISYVISGKKSFTNVIRIFIPVSLAALVVLFPSSPFANSKKENAEAMNILAEASMKRGDYDSAEKYIFESLPFYYNWSRTFNMLGNCYYVRKRYEESLVMYNHALKLDPEDYNAFMNIGIMYSELGDYKSAMSSFKTAFDREEKSPELFYNYAVMLMRMGRRDDALKSFVMALKLNPAQRMALNNIGIINFSNGNPAKAAEYFQKSLSLDPSNASLMVNLALALYSSGKKNEADKWREKAVRLDPENPNVKKLQGTCSAR